MTKIQRPSEQILAFNGADDDNLLLPIITVGIMPVSVRDYPRHLDTSSIRDPLVRVAQGCATGCHSKTNTRSIRQITSDTRFILGGGGGWHGVGWKGMADVISFRWRMRGLILGW